MAAYLRSGQFLTFFRFPKMSCKFFSSVSWSAFREMPLETRLVERLNDLGIENLTEIQQKSLGPILNGDDVIINAETGSGKTLCYLVPVVDKLLKLKTRVTGPSAVVLVPNMDLGFQITDLVNELFYPGMFACPLHRDSQLRISHKYPVIVSTPQTLMQYNIKSLRSSIKTIVIDEADLIISNGGKHLWELLRSFRDHVNSTKNEYRFKDANFTENKHFSNGDTSLQYVFAAATLPRRGEKSVLRKILNNFPNINHITSTKVHQYVPNLTTVDVFVNEEQKLPRLLKCLNILNGSLPLENLENLREFETHSKFAEYSTNEATSADVSRVNPAVPVDKEEKVKDIKVLVFANTVAMAQNIYEFLKCQEGSTFKILQKTDKCLNKEPVALTDSIIQHKFCEDFIKTTLSSKEELITNTGLTRSWRNTVGILHKEMSRSERQEVLTKFQENEITVLVSTDLASRGLDFCDISHVIQIDYARNAADMLHRAGRTARAGNSGTVINFITEQDKDLWKAVKLTEKGTGTEGFQEIFSRNRQFSRRIKKRLSRIDCMINNDQDG